MKAYTLMLIFFSPLAFACPQLFGDYKTCRSSGPDQSSSPLSIKVEQKIVNKFHQFKFTITSADEEAHTEIYFADGKAKIATSTDPDTGVVMKTQNLSTCLDQILSVKMNVTIDDEVLADMHLKVSQLNKQLILLYEGQSMGEQIRDIVTCQ